MEVEFPRERAKHLAWWEGGQYAAANRTGEDDESKDKDKDKKKSIKRPFREYPNE